MDYEELLKFLDIEEASEFEYFENAADLFECDEEIDTEAIELLLGGVDPNLMSDLIHEYFNELLEKMPERSVDIYTLMSTIGMSLAGLAMSIGEDEGKKNISVLAGEISRFRKWYTKEGIVQCRNIKTSEELSVPVGEAISLYRTESFSDDEYDYDFRECTDYPIEEYVMSFSDLVSAQYEDDDIEETDDMIPEDRM